MKQLFTLLLTLTALNAFAQKSIVICGEAYQYMGHQSSVTVLSSARQPVGAEFEYLARIPVELNDKFYSKIPLVKPRLIVIHYMGSSNIVYAYPGDSIHVSFKELNKADTIRSMMMTFTYKELWHYSGSDSARIAFFETIQKKTGQIDNPPFKMDITQPGFLADYKARVIAVYNRRLGLLDSLAKEFQFKNDFKLQAANEIRGEYISDLLYLSLFPELWNKYPAGYNDEIEHENFSWDKVKDSRSYRSALYTSYEKLFVIFFILKHYLLFISQKSTRRAIPFH